MRLKNKPGINENKRSNCEMVQERELAKYQNPNIPEMKCSTYTRKVVWLLSACSLLGIQKNQNQPNKRGNELQFAAFKEEKKHTQRSGTRIGKSTRSDH